MNKAEFAAEAQRIIAARLSPLRLLSYEQASAIAPVSDEQDVVVAGCKCQVATFAQVLVGGDVLIVVLVARPSFLGISRHTDGGLVFSPQKSVRDATDEEIRNNGG